MRGRVYAAILAKLRAEMKKRPKRSVGTSVAAELKSVLREVNYQRASLGYEPVRIESLEQAVNRAVDPSDYARAATDLVLRKKAT